MWQYNYSTELYHSGVPGMKWGVRRYQNKDGSLINAGKKHKLTTTVKDVYSSYKKVKHKTSYKLASSASWVGFALDIIGDTACKYLKDDLSTNQLAIAKGMKYSGMALETIGEVSIGAMVAKQYKTDKNGK